ncbi:antibiotic biosynthesis monooxygenase [Spongiactinospora rosea]|uniref:Antibiotic biosynthesis monooxygenase n=1 Tax=Spongiactinospora rosea TaxID=2248750 RepID=A0A366M3R7_9ACTN|nr:antibiotic biosynthesis monooxygenase family protein [Spongiactinospora rosea]RBQ20072.1 antibiotic biosynthesis monooxygenase [Spongiactinospora rosea]
MYTFINRFTVSGDAAEFEGLLGKITEYMSRQPGFRSYKLYRSSNDPKVYVETAEWDDGGSHKQAVGRDGFRALVGPVMKLATAEPGPFELVSQQVG